MKILGLNGKLIILICTVLCLDFAVLKSQTLKSENRSLRYIPEGGDFVITNGDRKFNRALYGTNTGYRTEAGDLPEFALYMPGMGGNLRFALISEEQGKWISTLENIKTIYRPGSMIYEISDRKYLGNGKLNLHVLSSADKEGFIIKVNFNSVSNNSLKLAWVFGGATGRRFSREGDIGADPESVFYLHPENCLDNEYVIHKEGFALKYGSGKVAPTPDKKKELIGLFPKGSYKIVNATKASDNNPLAILNSKAGKEPVFSGQFKAENNKAYYFSIYRPEVNVIGKYSELGEAFEKAENARLALVNRVKVNTPNPYINTLGGALTVAADGVWEYPTYLHGAVAWRMRLNAWRGAYIADILGWHDRAKAHFSSYSKSQVLSPETGPVVSDTLLNLARQKEVMGTSMFSSGYISRNPNANNRPHHYNMNLVFFDQIYTHFNWTRDKAFLEELWPTLERNMKWEKRNYDADGDGLYDAYAAIWASDGLQYSGGGVTHTTAYNYRANIEMARLAKLIGKDPKPYEKEAAHILQAVQGKLWLADKGWWAEYVDKLGNQLLHKQPGVWSIYHAIDSKVPNDFEAYQALRYIDTQIPHIPIKARGLENKELYTISTTNWHPYTWSVNNVALAEVMHTSLAYWQGNRKEKAFQLWESALIESMFLGASPGNFQQLSYYDAMRGELYRDFADPIAMAGRSLVEGLFGILPNAFENELLIKPGFPEDWNHASLNIPDLSFDFKKEDNKSFYSIVSKFPFEMKLKLQLDVHHSSIKKVMVNGKETKWELVANSVGNPKILIECTSNSQNNIIIEWGKDRVTLPDQRNYYSSDRLELENLGVELLEVLDPQKVLHNKTIHENKLTATFNQAAVGDRTIFLKVKKGDLTWYHPFNLNLKPLFQIRYDKEQPVNQIVFNIVSGKDIEGTDIFINPSFTKKPYKNFNISSGENKVNVDESVLIPGSNKILLLKDGAVLLDTTVINWNVNSTALIKNIEVQDLSGFFNDQITKVFENKYLSPRPSVTTLQLPTQGIGNWCYPLIKPELDDTGLRTKLEKQGNQIRFKENLVFSIPSGKGEKNVVFTSQWDNFPTKVTIPLKGKASHAYLLMGGTTNPMQSRFVNGVINIVYTDGTRESLELKNPENWWPIEQDYFIDDYAFAIDYPRPPRLYLKTGEFKLNNKEFYTIKGFSSFGVEGGAATVLDIPLRKDKNLSSIQLETKANDVIIGLMGVSLVR